jgi:AraC family transcriptional regulator of adaptative response / DNA-3-methyladenine glycosylase II
VKSTGIYCRPICPTHPPKLENCTFLLSAVEAERAGYRPCLRCRPEHAPANRSIDSRSQARHLARHIDETLLIDESLSQASRGHGLSERHLRRLFVATYGVEPKQYLTTRRLLFAKQLLQDTAMPITDVAFAAGFNTSGRLTINMREAYGFTPERFRKEGAALKAPGSITLRADFRPPFDWECLLDLLKTQATPLERVEGRVYYRMVEGYEVVVSNVAEKSRLSITLPIELARQSHTILQKVRGLFDLDANPLIIQEALMVDPLLGKLIKKYPGLRVPGCWDGFEMLVRVVIGQHISVVRATALMRTVTEEIGITPSAIAGSSPEALSALGLTRQRAATVQHLGRLVSIGELRLDERNPQAFYEQLMAVPGIEEWTAEMMRMRVLRWPDAFPAGDIGLRKALGMGSEKELLERAKAWRPWRSYAAVWLWRGL